MITATNYYQNMPVSIDWKCDGSFIYKGYIEKKLRKNFRVRIPRDLEVNRNAPCYTSFRIPGSLLKKISPGSMARQKIKVKQLNENAFIRTDGGLKKSRFKGSEKRGDCVVRSFAIALGKPYEEVFDSLCELSKGTGYFSNIKQTYEIYLKRNGWEKKKARRVKGKLIRLRDFNSKDMTAIVETGGHLVCVINGNVYDTGDCRTSLCRDYWTQKEN